MPDETAIQPLTDQLRAFLADRDVPCPQCDYNLRDQVGDRCPECGERIVLHVNLAEPLQGWLLAGLIGLSAGAGLNGLLLLYWLILMWRHRAYPPEEAFNVINGTGFLVLGVLMALWLRWWRPIRRRSAATRALLALGCWALTLTDLVIFSIYVR